jgi:hypothetical protein
MSRRWVHVELDERTLEALHVLADRELREPRQQARALILEGLRRSGAIADDTLGAMPERVAVAR